MDRGESLESTWEFVRDLEKIDLDYTPPELRSAVEDYIAAMKEGLADVEAGRDSSVADQLSK